METKIMKIVAQSEKISVPSRKSESGQIDKCVIHLKELNDFGDEIIATILGNLASCRFAPGKVVAVSLRMSTHENNGQQYQDIIVNDIQEI